MDKDDVVLQKLNKYGPIKFLPEGPGMARELEQLRMVQRQKKLRKSNLVSLEDLSHKFEMEKVALMDKRQQLHDSLLDTVRISTFEKSIDSVDSSE